MAEKKLYRSVADRKIAGVCGGLAEYLGLDPLLVRILMVVLALVSGAGVLFYILVWILVPEVPSRDGSEAA
jgi:phage shock protein C